MLVKQGKAPGRSAHDSHVAQILIYCVLVHEQLIFHRPTVSFDTATAPLRLIINAKAAEAILDLVDEMHHNTSTELPRSHQNPRFCHACSHRKSCDEKLT